MTTYRSGQEPTFWDPNPSVPEHRFALGRAASGSMAGSPLIAICMNPSRANELVSDRTVNRVIDASIDLGRAGWIILNLYPERASSPKGLSPYDPALSAENCAAIERVLLRYGAKEVLGAWGDLNPTLRRAKADVLAMLLRLGVDVFYLDNLTGGFEPRHPSPRGARLAMTGPKRYLSW